MVKATCYLMGFACLLGVVGLMVGLPASALAHKKVPLKKVLLQLRFHDSVTGRALVAEVGLIHLTTQKSYGLTSKRDGRAKIVLPEGDYELIATSEGYHSMGLIISVKAPMPPYHFFMEPVEPPLESRTEFLKRLSKAGQMVVLGWLMDEVSGQPIVGARIRVLKTGTRAVSDKRGFFMVQFPVEPFKSGYATILIKRAGYRTLQLDRVLVWSGGVVHHRLTMQPGSGRDVMDMRPRADPGAR